jgi:methionyl-tRNA synthetase
LKAPWKLAKDPAQSDLLDDVLFYLVEASRFVASLMAPVIPSATEKILQQLNATAYDRLAWDELPDQHRLGTPSPVFPRFEE